MWSVGYSCLRKVKLEIRPLFGSWNLVLGVLSSRGSRHGIPEHLHAIVLQVLLRHPLQIGSLHLQVAIEFGVDQVSVAVEDVVAGEALGTGLHRPEGRREFGFLLVPN